METINNFQYKLSKYQETHTTRVTGDGNVYMTAETSATCSKKHG